MPINPDHQAAQTWSTFGYASEEAATPNRLRVGIVGGSIGGCTAAVALASLGYDVTVFERSTGRLEDRGAGIGMPISLLDKLKQRGLVSHEFACLLIDTRHYLIRSQNWMGRELWQQPLGELALTNWGVLFRQLRARVPNAIYHAGVEVKEVDQADNTVILRLAAGGSEKFDLVVFADGIDSLGRSALFPDAKLEYSGYVAWRGLVEEALAPEVVSFQDPADRTLTGQHAAMGARGHGIVYLVPGRKGETQVGHRLINWLWYENVPRSALQTALASRNKEFATNKGPAAMSVPPGDMPEARIQFLRTEAARLFPSYFADIVEKTTEPFVQAIFDMHVSHYKKGRICLIGDAATVVRPNSASGVVHSMSNAMALADTLATAKSVDAGLATWSREQEAFGERLYKLGRSVGDALQNEAINWAEMTPALMAGWWESIISGQRWYVTDTSGQGVGSVS